MTIWLILIILAIGIVWLIKKQPKKGVRQQHTAEQQATDELIAVITAAIAECTHLSSDEVKILNINAK